MKYAVRIAASWVEDNDVVYVYAESISVPTFIYSALESARLFNTVSDALDFVKWGAYHKVLAGALAVSAPMETSRRWRSLRSKRSLRRLRRRHARS